MGAVPNETRIVASLPCEATATTTSKDNEGHKDRHVLLSPHLLELFRAGAKQRWTSSYRHFPRSDRASCESSNPWPTPFDGAMLPSADIVGHPSNNGSSKGNSSSQRTDMLTAATCTNRPGRKCDSQRHQALQQLTQDQIQVLVHRSSRDRAGQH